MKLLKSTLFFAYLTFSKQLTPLKVLPARLEQMWALPLRFFAEKWNHFSIVLLQYITQRVVGTLLFSLI